MAYIDEQFSQLATDLIKYQEKHNLDDNTMAVKLMMSVERYHAIKSMWEQPTEAEVKDIKDFLIHNK
ncbi:LBP_cg2779 family protein [Fructilactobacillus frigidiflavus]|uniref:LBP_cg2779 family protein n=1 Tax=Fructilactobacillus frigidiflavus TaxID=3242688 RepID=UPI0037570C75